MTFDPKFPDGDPAVSPACEDPEIVLAAMTEAEEERAALDVVEEAIWTRLEEEGIDDGSFDMVTGLQLDETGEPIPGVTLSGLAEMVGVVANAVHFGDVRLPDRDFDPRADQDVFEIKTHAALALQVEPTLGATTRQILIDVLGERMQPDVSEERGRAIFRHVVESHFPGLLEVPPAGPQEQDS